MQNDFRGAAPFIPRYCGLSAVNILTSEALLMRTALSRHAPLKDTQIPVLGFFQEDST